MLEALRQMVTGKDNSTHDVGRWFAVLGGLTGIGLSIYDVVHNGVHFDMQSFGLGMAAMATGVGAMLKLKEGTEPCSKPD